MVGVVQAAQASAQRVDFNREIRPLLSDNCFTCHGPDENARKAKLRLDVRAAALEPRRSGEAAVVPGEPERSLLVARITTEDTDDLMPPPATGKRLEAGQRDKLRRWIAEGADWPEHWAYRRPERPAVPELEPAGWARNPIDHFVHAQLARAGQEPSPEADAATLARRASLDLTGLPPLIEEMDTLLADGSPAAYGALVDRLLASPRYGEHQARFWLDAARYADSHGYHIDAQRDIWAYRDWVVNAFNTNQSFDQFTLEQLAGDLLPEPTTAQRIATGYLRCNMSTGEGGAIEAEYAAKYAFDRVETTATAWLGLTLVCARCHTHKYDPITQPEYYGLLAFFNNLDEPVMDGNKPNPDPFLKLPSRDQSERLAWLTERLRVAQDKLDGPDADLDRTQPDWMQRHHDRLRTSWRAATLVRADSLTHTNVLLRPLDDASILVSGELPPTDAYRLTYRLEAGRLGGLRLMALPDPALPKAGAARAADGKFQLSEIEAELRAPCGGTNPPVRLRFARALADTVEGEHSPERALDGKAETGWLAGGDPTPKPCTALFLLAEPVAIPEGAELDVRLRFESSPAHRALGRFRLSLALGEALLQALEPPSYQPWQVLGPLPTAGLEAGFAHAYGPEQAVDLKQTYAGVRGEVRWAERADLTDGKTHLLVHDLHGVHGAFYLYRKVQSPVATPVELSLRADDLFKLWVNGNLLLERAELDPNASLSTRVRVDLQPGENAILVKVVNHQGAKHFAFQAQAGDPDQLTADLAAMLSTTPVPPEAWRVAIRDSYRRAVSPAFRELGDQRAMWQEERTALEAAIPTTLIAKERAQPRDTFLLARGEYDQPGEKVSPSMPAFLLPLPAGAPTNRLGLAQWLVDPAHPLTARVAMNRFWQQCFGVGLVKTAEDFGVQGEPPSHPELLDWLATEFVASGWDVKHMLRLIVTSATYRQRSHSTPEQYARDPENRSLARGPRFRPDAEVLRDSALSIGGLLVERRGGPSVKPFEPPGLWEAVSFNNSQKYVPDTGEATYRRSLYTHWKRQSPPPNMLLFDAPTREFCVARRPRTNTPLQALTLLNDPQYVEAARALARRMLVDGGLASADRLAYGFRLATGRHPAAADLEILQAFLEQQLAEYQADPGAAEQLLGVGGYRPPTSLDPARWAAWTTLASLLLNLDETLTKG